MNDDHRGCLTFGADQRARGRVQRRVSAAFLSAMLCVWASAAADYLRFEFLATAAAAAAAAVHTA